MISSNAAERTTNHRIVIDNVKSGEVLNYSLLICKGHIENPNNSNCKPLTDLQIKITHDKIQNLVSINPKIGTFQFIIELKPGGNVINFFFCCTSTNIILELKIRNTNLSVVPLYVICDGHDGTFQAPKTETNTPESACKRIITGCKMIQSLFAEKMYEAGFGRKTFQLKSSICLVFYSKLHVEKAYKMGQLELWYYFAREIMTSSIGSNDKKYLAFLSCTKYDGSRYSEGIEDHHEIVGLTKGYVAFGGKGLALLGAACLYTWPQNVMEIENRFKDSLPVDKTKFMDDSCYRGTVGGCFSTTLGAALHELCHTFDLGHSEYGIMGRGFDNVQNVFLANDCDDNCNKNVGVNFHRFSYIQSNYKGNDDTYWMENHLLLLSCHKWFNDINVRRHCILRCDRNSKIIKSTAGLRVVEIRRKSDEMVLRYWIFRDRILKYSYQITAKLETTEDMILVVVDNEGNILKEPF